MTVEAMFRAHPAEVLAYAMRRTDAASAQDVVSEVFLIAGRRGPEIASGRELAWLYGTARRVLANQRRAARRRARLTTALGVLGRARSQQPASDRGTVLEALAALRPADREVLMLIAWEGLDGEQAAEALGCSAAAVHTRLHRARGRLAAELDRRDASCPVPLTCPEVSG